MLVSCSLCRSLAVSLQSRCRRVAAANVAGLDEMICYVACAVFFKQKRVICGLHRCHPADAALPPRCSRAATADVSGLVVGLCNLSELLVLVFFVTESLVSVKLADCRYAGATLSPCRHCEYQRA